MEIAENVTTIRRSRNLSDAIRDAKNAAADKADVLADMREVNRTRLEVLAAELKPVFDAVPTSIDSFDFAISSGLEPRLWIDAVAQVAIGRDGRTYRFLRDTRVGRMVLIESTQIKPVADHVTRYIAERIVERERQIEGDADALANHGRSFGEEAEKPIPARLIDRDWFPVLRGLAFFAAGVIIAMAFIVAAFWDQIARLLPGA